MNPTIQTVTGKVISFVEPGNNVYDIMDIAHGLSNMCRYSGQCNHFYSVAQHSVLVSYLVPLHKAMEALMHDGTEAYMCDIPSPLKLCIPQYKAIERDMDVGIRFQYALPSTMSPEVKYADALALAIEKPHLMKNIDMEWSDMPEVPEEWANRPIALMYPPEAKALFLARYAELKYLL